MEEKFGSFLQQLRKERGWTQKELGSKLHVSDKTISKWENNQSVPSIDMLESIARCFGITLSELFGYGQKDAPMGMTVDILEQTHRQQEALKKQMLRVVIAALVLMVALLIAMSMYFQTQRNTDRESVKETISLMLPGGESVYQYPFRIPNGAKEFTVRLVNATGETTNSRDIIHVDLTDDFYQQGVDGIMDGIWKMILYVDATHYDWSYKLVDGAGSVTSFYNLGPAYVESAKDQSYGLKTMNDSPSAWNDDKQSILTPMIGDPFILYSIGFAGSEGLTSFGNDWFEINDKLTKIPESLSRVLVVDLLFQ